MEYCSGGDLRAILQQRAGVLFPQDRILDWFVQLCLAVKYIHDRHILHRDIKSQNIFLTEAGRIKLGDFGISKMLDNSKDLANTCVGTPYYLSPEICQNKPYNSKSDVWALGCVLYEMASLKHPFEATCMKSLVMKIMKGTFRPVPSKFTWDFKALIRQILLSNPLKRPSVTTILSKKILIERVPKFVNRSEDNLDLFTALRERQDLKSQIKKFSPYASNISVSPRKKNFSPHSPKAKYSKNSSPTPSIFPRNTEHQGKKSHKLQGNLCNSKSKVFHVNKGCKPREGYIGNGQVFVESILKDIKRGKYMKVPPPKVNSSGKVTGSKICKTPTSILSRPSCKSKKKYLFMSCHRNTTNAQQQRKSKKKSTSPEQTECLHSPKFASEEANAQNFAKKFKSYDQTFVVDSRNRDSCVLSRSASLTNLNVAVIPDNRDTKSNSHDEIYQLGQDLNIVDVDSMSVLELKQFRRESIYFSSTPLRNRRSRWGRWDAMSLAETSLEITKSQMDKTSADDKVIVCCSDSFTSIPMIIGTQDAHSYKGNKVYSNNERSCNSSSEVPCPTFNKKDESDAIALMKDQKVIEDENNESVERKHWTSNCSDLINVLNNATLIEATLNNCEPMSLGSIAASENVLPSNGIDFKKNSKTDDVDKKLLNEEFQQENLEHSDELCLQLLESLESIETNGETHPCIYVDKTFSIGLKDAMNSSSSSLVDDEELTVVENISSGHIVNPHCDASFHSSTSERVENAVIHSSKETIVSISDDTLEAKFACPIVHDESNITFRERLKRKTSLRTGISGVLKKLVQVAAQEDDSLEPDEDEFTDMSSCADIFPDQCYESHSDVRNTSNKYNSGDKGLKNSVDGDIPDSTSESSKQVSESSNCDESGYGTGIVTSSTSHLNWLKASSNDTLSASAAFSHSNLSVQNSLLDNANLPCKEPSTEGSFALCISSSTSSDSSIKLLVDSEIQAKTCESEETDDSLSHNEVTNSISSIKIISGSNDQAKTHDVKRTDDNSSSSSVKVINDSEVQTKTCESEETVDSLSHNEVTNSSASIKIISGSKDQAKNYDVKRTDNTSHNEATSSSFSIKVINDSEVQTNTCDLEGSDDNQSHNTATNSSSSVKVINDFNGQSETCDADNNNQSGDDALRNIAELFVLEIFSQSELKLKPSCAKESIQQEEMLSPEIQSIHPFACEGLHSNPCSKQPSLSSIAKKAEVNRLPLGEKYCVHNIPSQENGSKIMSQLYSCWQGTISAVHCTCRSVKGPAIDDVVIDPPKIKNISYPAKIIPDDLIEENKPTSIVEELNCLKNQNETQISSENWTFDSIPTLSAVVETSVLLNVVEKLKDTIVSAKKCSSVLENKVVSLEKNRGTGMVIERHDASQLLSDDKWEPYISVSQCDDSASLNSVSDEGSFNSCQSALIKEIKHPDLEHHYSEEIIFPGEVFITGNGIGTARESLNLIEFSSSDGEKTPPSDDVLSVSDVLVSFSTRGIDADMKRNENNSSLTNENLLNCDLGITNEVCDKELKLADSDIECTEEPPHPSDKNSIVCSDVSIQPPPQNSLAHCSKSLKNPCHSVQQSFLEEKSSHLSLAPACDGKSLHLSLAPACDGKSSHLSLAPSCDGKSSHLSLAPACDGKSSHLSLAPACDGKSSHLSLAPACDGKSSHLSLAPACDGKSSHLLLAPACDGKSSHLSLAPACDGKSSHLLLAPACDGKSSHLSLAPACDGAEKEGATLSEDVFGWIEEQKAHLEENLGLDLMLKCKLFHKLDARYFNFGIS